MNNPKPIQTSEELVQAFADLFDEIAPDTPEEVDAVLREAGYDPDKVAERMRAAAARAIAASPLNWRARAQRELEKARTRLERPTPTSARTRTDIVDAIESLVTQLDPNTRHAHAYRNLESLSHGDLASLLDELEYLTREQGGENGEQ